MVQTTLSGGSSNERKLSWTPIVACCAVFITFPLTGCGERDSIIYLSVEDSPLHLEEHLDSAKFVVAQAVQPTKTIQEWMPETLQSEWRSFPTRNGDNRGGELGEVANAVRVQLGDRDSGPYGIYTSIPNWNREDWAYVQIEAQTSGNISAISIVFNLRDSDRWKGEQADPFENGGEFFYPINDGRRHAYQMRADWSWGSWRGPWTHLGIKVEGESGAALDIFSIHAIRKDEAHRGRLPHVVTEVRGGSYRRAIAASSNADMAFPILIPENARCDFGMGVLRDDIPVTFTVSITDATGRSSRLFNRTYKNKRAWSQQSVDLSAFSGQRATLTLSSSAPAKEAISLWASPTVSGDTRTRTPNVILYIIDGAGADYISAYGYERPTTPNLEKLAAEGVLFERAYSNSTWSKTSTPSFMTSLQHGALGGYESDSDPLPDEVITMAEHFHRAGYLTGVFTTNPYAGTLSSLERGADRLRDEQAPPGSISSSTLQKDFWNWRNDYSQRPFWVHFQTTDVHWTSDPAPLPKPFSGMFVTSEQRREFRRHEQILAAASGFPGPTWPQRYSDQAYEESGIDRREFFETVSGMYDEAMAYNDYEIGRLVARLKETGEWGRTLFIVAADHGDAHGMQLLNPRPSGLPFISSLMTGIPMIVVWPGHIAPGQRRSQPVSMIDVLPTVLELCGIKAENPMQGRSLVPLLLKKGDWRPSVVVLDETYYNSVDKVFSGTVGLIDEMWGAVVSATSHAVPEPTDPLVVRELRLFDLSTDPLALHDLSGEYPEMVAKYTELLLSEWSRNLSLGSKFTRQRSSILHPQQLEALGSLGYL